MLDLVTVTQKDPRKNAKRTQKEPCLLILAQWLEHWCTTLAVAQLLQVGTHLAAAYIHNPKGFIAKSVKT